MTTQDEQAAFFGAGGTRGGDPERVNGRYKFVDPFGNTVSAMTASNFGFPLADQYGLNKWRMRELVKGIAQRQDLIALLSVLDRNSKGKIDEIISTAMEVSGTSAEANKGTAIHEALRLADMGLPYPEMFEPFVASYRAELQRFGLTVGLIEATVYSPGLNARGDLDRTFIEADGGHVLGDIKSTGHLEDQAHEISVQMAVYQSATHYRDAEGNWHPIPRGKHPLRDDYAIIVHVDREHATVTLYRLDLWVGKRGANLAEQVRQWRKEGPVLLPYAPPGTPVTEAAWQLAPVPTIGDMVQAEIDSTPILPPLPEAAPSAADVAQVQRVADPAGEMPWSSPAPEPQTMAAALADGEIERAGEPALPPADFSAEATGLPVGCSKPATLKATDLLSPKVTKAQAQEYCREHGMTDLAHTKKVLVDMLRKRGCLLSEGITPDAELHPTRTKQFQQMTLAKISNVSSVGELQIIHQDVVRQGGEQAWLPEYTKASRAKVAELDAGGVQDPIYDRVAQCQSSEDLGRLWEEVTVGGTVTGNWTPAIQAAAMARIDEINKAAPPVAGNPFSG